MHHLYLRSHLSIPPTRDFEGGSCVAAGDSDSKNQTCYSTPAKSADILGVEFKSSRLE